MIHDMKEYRKRKIYGFKIALYLYIKFGKPIRKKGGIDETMRHKLRHNLGFTAFMHRDGAIEKSKSIMLQFLMDKKVKNGLIQNGRDSYHLMTKF